MSPLATALADYLTVRRRLGFKLVRAGQLLRDFVAFMDEHDATTVTTELAMAWATRPSDGQPAWWGARLSAVRIFARHLQTIDLATEVPPADILPARRQRATPYLYSASDIDALIAAARRLRSEHRAATYATLIGLLAVTGMRVGEAIRLDLDDIDWSAGSLTIRASKFGKSREVVLHPTTTEALRAYARRRQQLCARPGMPSFFVSTTGSRLIYQNVHSTFHQLVGVAGLAPRSPRCRPRPHDLRHTFAVNTLLAWYRDGLDVVSRIHLLSTYLGHLEPSHTYWYLSASPELLGLVAERLERTLGELP
jgi:integrase/recombinase XerD